MIGINNYKVGDVVEILINNPRNNNKDEWRGGVVIAKRMVEHWYDGKDSSYPIIVVKSTRTYCKTTERFKLVNGINFYNGTDLTFFDNENDEMIIYPEHIRIKLTN